MMEVSSTRKARLARVGSSLLRVLNTIEESIDFAARQGNIHPTDLRCIAFLMDRNTPASPREIISFLGLSSGSGTALLDRLEQAGYAKRIPNPNDRRSVLVMLDTDVSAEPIALMRNLQARYRSGLESFSERELDVIGEYLDRVCELTTERGTLSREDATRRQPLSAK